MKKIKNITLFFSAYDWFIKVEKTSRKNEFLVFVKIYPYSFDYLFRQCEIEYKVRIMVHAIQ